MSRSVILVDEQNTDIGRAELLEAHGNPGMLHRAFSVYLFDTTKEHLLIQKRSHLKMLWPLTWANTCCSHPFPGETSVDAGRRRLMEELGIESALTQGPSYVYRAVDPRGKGTEHEYVTTLIGVLPRDCPVHPDHTEVAAWTWTSLQSLAEEFKNNADAYAPWLHIGLPKIVESPVFQTLL